MSIRGLSFKESELLYSTKTQNLEPITVALPLTEDSLALTIQAIDSGQTQATMSKLNLIQKAVPVKVMVRIFFIILVGLILGYLSVVSVAVTLFNPLLALILVLLLAKYLRWGCESAGQLRSTLALRRMRSFLEGENRRFYSSKLLPLHQNPQLTIFRVNGVMVERAWVIYLQQFVSMKEGAGWDFKDHIRAHVQREQIDRIIRQQRNHPSNPPLHLDPPPLPLPRKPQQTRKYFVSAHSLQRHRPKIQPPQLRNPSPSSLREEMEEQITYFSVKCDYEKIIGSTDDPNLERQLRGQLLSSPKQGRSWQPRSSNFFQSVANTENRLRRSFLVRRVSGRERREEGW